ncbi:hypothetical protein FFLO_04588 [Filobasidium floriforme]|uniref:Uncharacterized protein n=1 Tax=Filobasidium floriforme TaxID=5210 RepID=A0A8K0NM84_9TREE|nr:uncharacterized protein HD553DRAFT_325526 [Filobasidium floriforme]KAG7531094.1 hypothetical protein FFLO_04588 [Filobasidium floriforme]KAH8081530.1 hypothetical protein HD553DRAFT_325526 [Filobasidium floriforme]
MPTNITACPPSDAAAPPADDEKIAVKVANNESFCVKYELLMLSSVLRDAFHMQSLSGGASDKQAIKNAEIELNCTAGQAKWLFGILEGKGLNDLKESTMRFSSVGPSLGSLMSSEDATTPSPIVLRHVLRSADFYDFPFFPRIMKEVLYELADKGTAYALSAAAMAIDQRDLKMARYAIKHMGGLPSPLAFDKLAVQAIGLDVWWCLVDAYRRTIADARTSVRVHYDTQTQEVAVPWSGDLTQWTSIANAIVFE